MKQLTNPTAPRDAGRQTPAARAYSNARRAGRTRPGLIEILADDDPRRLPVQYVPNRREIRAYAINRRGGRR